MKILSYLSVSTAILAVACIGVTKEERIDNVDKFFVANGPGYLSTITFLVQDKQNPDNILPVIVTVNGYTFIKDLRTDQKMWVRIPERSEAHFARPEIHIHNESEIVGTSFNK